MKWINRRVRHGGWKRSTTEEVGWNGGFTLLELIISITLIATIVLVISGALRLGYRSVNSGERKMESLERFRASMTIFKAQIESMVPLGIEQQGVKQYYFQGGADSMKLVTNYSIWGGEKGYVSVEYRVETANNGTQNLYASEAPVGMTAQKQTRLFMGLDRIFFEYYLEDDADLEGAWVTDCNDNTKMPVKIRLWLVQGRREIALIIPIRARSA